MKGVGINLNITSKGLGLTSGPSDIGLMDNIYSLTQGLSMRNWAKEEAEALNEKGLNGNNFYEGIGYNYTYGDSLNLLTLERLKNGFDSYEFGEIRNDKGELARGLTTADEEGRRKIKFGSLESGTEFAVDLAHESWRDGYENIGTYETVSSVISHTKMANALMKEHGRNVFSNRGDLQFEADIYEKYGTIGLATYAAEAYDSSADYWLLMEDGSLVMDGDGWLKDSNGNYILDESGNKIGANGMQGGLQKILGISAEEAVALLKDQNFVNAGKEGKYWNNANNANKAITLENKNYSTQYDKLLKQHNTLNIYNQLVENGQMKTAEYDAVYDALGKNIADATYGSGDVSYEDWKKNNFIKDPDNIMERLNFTEPLGDKPKISSKYGNRKHPVTGEESFHTGYDYPAKENTSFNVLYNGKVSSVGYTWYGGNTLTIEHDMSIIYKGKETSTSFFSEYMHMYNQNNSTGTSWKVGDNIYTSDIAGYVGNTGEYTTGSHLHAGTYIPKENPLYNWLSNTDYLPNEKGRGLFFDYRSF